jgi:UDP-glucose 4-epimerase
MGSHRPILRTTAGFLPASIGKSLMKILVKGGEGFLEFNVALTLLNRHISDLAGVDVQVIQGSHRDRGPMDGASQLASPSAQQHFAGLKVKANSRSRPLIYLSNDISKRKPTEAPIV